MTFFKRFLSSLALSTIAFAMAFTEVAGAADPIKIGMTVSSQGRFALAAQSGERGLKIWVNDVNRCSRLRIMNKAGGWID